MDEVKKEAEVPKVKKERYELTQVVTETGIAVKDNDTEEILSGEKLLVEILNKINKIEKALV